MAGDGNTQIINGGAYVMYSPEWYAARQAEAQRAAIAQGTAGGAALKAGANAAGVPLTGSSSSSSSSGSTFSAPALPPSIAGLTQAAAGVNAPSGGGGVAPRAQIAPVDTRAAEAATFNRAKDQVGEESSGALTGLRSALAGRNLLGGGLEGMATAQAATGAARELGDVTRQSAITKAGLDNANATTNFQGGITQRGQDIQREESANSLAGDLAKTTYEGQIQQRGQDIQALNAAKALEIEQAQMASQQRSTALAGLTAALRVTSNDGLMY
jgi:hypothetical protein